MKTRTQYFVFAPTNQLARFSAPTTRACKRIRILRENIQSLEQRRFVLDLASFWPKSETTRAINDALSSKIAEHKHEIAQLHVQLTRLDQPVVSLRTPTWTTRRTNSRITRKLERTARPFALEIEQAHERLKNEAIEAIKNETKRVRDAAFTEIALDCELWLDPNYAEAYAEAESLARFYSNERRYAQEIAFALREGYTMGCWHDLQKNSSPEATNNVHTIVFDEVTFEANIESQAA